MPIITKKNLNGSQRKKHTMYRGIKRKMKVDFFLKIIEGDKIVDQHL